LIIKELNILSRNIQINQKAHLNANRLELSFQNILGMPRGRHTMRLGFDTITLYFNTFNLSKNFCELVYESSFYQHKITLEEIVSNRLNGRFDRSYWGSLNNREKDIYALERDMLFIDADQDSYLPNGKHWINIDLQHFDRLDQKKRYYFTDKGFEQSALRISLYREKHTRKPTLAITTEISKLMSSFSMNTDLLEDANSTAQALLRLEYVLRKLGIEITSIFDAIIGRLDIATDNYIDMSIDEVTQLFNNSQFKRNQITYDSGFLIPLHRSLDRKQHKIKLEVYDKLKKTKHDIKELKKQFARKDLTSSDKERIEQHIIARLKYLKKHSQAHKNLVRFEYRFERKSIIQKKLDIKTLRDLLDNFELVISKTIKLFHDLLPVEAIISNRLNFQSQTEIKLDEMIKGFGISLIKEKFSSLDRFEQALYEDIDKLKVSSRYAIRKYCKTLREIDSKHLDQIIQERELSFNDLASDPRLKQALGMANDKCIFENPLADLLANFHYDTCIREQAQIKQALLLCSLTGSTLEECNQPIKSIDHLLLCSSTDIEQAQTQNNQPTENHCDRLYIGSTLEECNQPIKSIDEFFLCSSFIDEQDQTHKQDQQSTIKELNSSSTKSLNLVIDTHMTKFKLATYENTSNIEHADRDNQLKLDHQSFERKELSISTQASKLISKLHKTRKKIELLKTNFASDRGYSSFMEIENIKGYQNHIIQQALALMRASYKLPFKRISNDDEFSGYFDLWWSSQDQKLKLLIEDLSLKTKVFNELKWRCYEQLS
jgi:hypothetical protein